MQHLSQNAAIFVMKDSFCVAAGITANHFPDLARSRSTWLACRCGGTDSALVDCQLLTFITSHMCHSKHMRCIDVISGTDVINGRTPEWLNLLSMNEDSDHELDELQTICVQDNRLISLRIISDDQCDISCKKIR